MSTFLRRPLPRIMLGGTEETGWKSRVTDKNDIEENLTRVRARLADLDAERHELQREMAALEALHRAEVAQKHVTGLLYFNPGKPTLDETLNLVETPLAELPDERLRPSRESLEELLAGLRG